MIEFSLEPYLTADDCFYIMTIKPYACLGQVHLLPSGDVQVYLMADAPREPTFPSLPSAIAYLRLKVAA